MLLPSLQSISSTRPGLLPARASVCSIIAISSIITVITESGAP